MSQSINVTVRSDTRLARVLLRGIRLIAPMLGYERALRWGKAAVLQTMRVRFDNGPWQRIKAEVQDAGEVWELDPDGTTRLLYPAGSPEALIWHEENKYPHDLEP